MEDYKIRRLINGDVVDGEKVIAKCSFGGHKGYLTKKLVESHDCINKNCIFFEKLNLEYWHARESQAKSLKNKSKQKRAKLKYDDYLNDYRDLMIKDYLEKKGHIHITKIKDEDGRLWVYYISDAFVDLKKQRIKLKKRLGMSVVLVSRKAKKEVLEKIFGKKMKKMIFKDLLMQVRVEDVVNSIMKRFDIDDTKYSRVLDKHREFFELLYELNPILTNNIIVFSMCESFDESFISESIYDLDEIKNNDEIEKELKRLENIGIDEIQKIIGITKLSQGFSMMYVPWEEILGYQVSEKNIADIGKADFVATIIYEMTFFGFTQEELNAEREKLTKIIEEQKEIEKLPEEERAKHYVSIEELFDDLDDDEEQEKIDTENNLREWVRNKKCELEVLVDIKNKLSL